jgi:hypothetical protein
MGVLLGCPTESPKEKNKSGDEDTATGTRDFTFANEHKDFHSYYVEVSSNAGSTLSDVVFVVSTAETPKILNTIDNTAQLKRTFTALQTRKISIAWQDTFNKNVLYVEATDTNADGDKDGKYNIVDGKYVPSTDTDGDGDSDDIA